MKFMILAPMYRTIDVNAHQTFCGMLLDMFNKGDKASVFFTNATNIGIARNNLFKVAAQKAHEFDYIISVDSDHLYSAKALYTLIEHLETNKLDMLSAAYIARGGGLAPKYAMLKKGEDGKLHKIPLKAGETGLVECDAVGFGFIVFKPAFVKEMVDNYHVLFRMDVDDCLGEDIYFCRLVQERGHKIFFDQDVRIGHLDTIAI